MSIKVNLSGHQWWEANQKDYPNSRSLEDLDATFRTPVSDFIAALKEAGASVNIASTRRNAIRAHLMHYSWKVGHGMIPADEVPKKSGLNIEWDHGNAEDSKEAAMEMVRLFNMAHIASLQSNHIAGKAIDMNISWKGKLVLKIPLACGLYEIADGPKSGQENRDLHWYGEQYFGVKKLRSDPPHWSHNGR